MSSHDDYADPIHNDLYDQTYSDIHQLQTQLPEEAVVSLAREVLGRLSQQLKGPAPQKAQIRALCEALLDTDRQAAARMINQRAKEGVGFDALYLEHLAPAAKMLGEWWESDKIQFTKVTVGTGRIYAIMRNLNNRRTQPLSLDAKSAFFCCTPGDNHTLGVKMAGDLARKAGWRIETDLDGDHDQIIDKIIDEDHLLIGISAAGVHSVPNLAKLVLALRVSAPAARIMVSGNLTETAPKSVQLMHVDGVGTDYKGAMHELDRLWDMLVGNA